jgi:hypothetical protein
MSGLGRSSEPLEVGFCGYFPCRRFAFSSSIQRSGSALIRFDGRDVVMDLLMASWCQKSYCWRIATTNVVDLSGFTSRELECDHYVLVVMCHQVFVFASASYKKQSCILRGVFGDKGCRFLNDYCVILLCSIVSTFRRRNQYVRH